MSGTPFPKPKKSTNSRNFDPMPSMSPDRVREIVEETLEEYEIDSDEVSAYVRYEIMQLKKEIKNELRDEMLGGLAGFDVSSIKKLVRSEIRSAFAQLSRLLTKI